MNRSQIKLSHSRLARGDVRLRLRLRGILIHKPTVQQKLSGRRMTRATRQTGHLVTQGSY